MSETAVISGRMMETPSPAQGCVLIIDDEAEIRESLQTLLEFEGYEVEAAANGVQGLSKLGDRPFDLVLLDLALPWKVLIPQVSGQGNMGAGPGDPPAALAALENAL